MADDLTPRPISHGPNALWEMQAEVDRLSQRAEQAEAERDAANASWYRMILRADEAEAYLLVSERRRIEQGVATGEANQRAERAEAERDALKAATDRVRAWHHPMPVYDGDPDCLDGGGCVHGEDYPDGEEGPNGGFCPHTSKAAVICFACSYQDTEGEGGTWPRWGWVLHENCATIARLDHPTDTTGETETSP